MSKEEAAKVVKIQTFDLKVNIHCECDGCKRKVDSLLRKIDGVHSTKIHAEQGKVTVSGNVDPGTLIKKLQKKGKHAELWTSKGGNAQLNKQFQAMQSESAEGPGDGKPQKGEKDQRGQRQQQQLQQMKGLNLPQIKDMKLPTKDQKSVKFSLHEDDCSNDGDFDGDGDGDAGDGDCDGFDGDFDLDPDEVKAHPKTKAMSQQLPPMGAPAMNNDKKGGAVVDVPVQNKAMVGNGDSKNGNGGKKGGGNSGGGQNQGGDAKTMGKNGGPQDQKNGSDGGGNNNASGGGKKGGGSNKNEMGHPMPNNMGHGLHQMGLNKAANVGQMGNLPVGQRGNIPTVQRLPAAALPGMNAGRYFQGTRPEFLAGNPYHQQYAAMMMQQRQNGMNARPPYPVNYMPQPPPQAGESYYNMFSDENPNSCSIM